MSIDSLIEIIDVVKYIKQNQGLLRGFSIDKPTRDYKSNKYELLLEGWVLGTASRVVAIEIISDGLLLQHIPVDGSRPDIARKYPEAEFAGISGFSSNIPVEGMPIENELLIQAVFSDHNRSLLGIIKFRKYLPFLERVQKELEESSSRLMKFQEYLENYRSRVPN
jgi:hypothetical protein